MVEDRGCLDRRGGIMRIDKHRVGLILILGIWFLHGLAAGADLSSGVDWSLAKVRKQRLGIGAKSA